MALARGGFAVFLLALLIVIEGADVCTYQYSMVPSTEAVEHCNIAGRRVILNCQVTGQANDNLSIYWYKTTNATLIGIQTLMPVTTEEVGYEVMESLNSNSMRSIVRSTLRVESVQESDFAYFWCWAALDGTHLLNPSSVVLLSPPCDSNIQQCSREIHLFTTLSDILCADGTAQPVQTPQPICTSQLTRLLSPATTSTATDSPLSSPFLSSASLTSTAIIALGMTSLNANPPTASIDPTPTQNLAAPPQLGTQPQAWIYAVAVVGALLCGIILILVLIVAVQYKMWRKGEKTGAAKTNEKIASLVPMQSCGAYICQDQSQHARQIQSQTNTDDTGDHIYDELKMDDATRNSDNSEVLKDHMLPMGHTTSSHFASPMPLQSCAAYTCQTHSQHASQLQSQPNMDDTGGHIYDELNMDDATRSGGHSHQRHGYSNRSFINDSHMEYYDSDEYALANGSLN